MAATQNLGPRVLIAGTSSGVGKTTITTALMASLSSKGLKVAPAKVGPDFIDPTYHALACGRRGVNLDTFLLGRDAIPGTLLDASQGSDISVIEGVMGLYDGSLMSRTEISGDLDPRITPGSTAEIAALTKTPIIIVADASSTSSSLAAVIEGFQRFSDQIEIFGVIINNYRSPSHLDLIKSGFKHVDVELLGAVPRAAFLSWKSRHLGLVPAVEDYEVAREAVDILESEVASRLDIERIAEIARSAPKVAATCRLRQVPSPRTVIAVANGPAFSFTYPENILALQTAGAEVRYFDPLTDTDLPEGTEGLYVGGGFPELFAKKLSQNMSLNVQVKNRIQSGLPTWAECGGLMWLAKAVDGVEMTGVLPTRIAMTAKLSLGYVVASPSIKSCVSDEGVTIYGHEFHYSKSSPPGVGILFKTRNGAKREGFVSSSLFASYLHVHLGSQQHLADRFVSACS